MFLIVLDACGVGALPDWQAFNDPYGANTLQNVIQSFEGEICLPNLMKLGLGEVCKTPYCKIEGEAGCMGIRGKLAELSNGKDTTTGHWEMTGLVSEKSFPVYPKGFPPEIIRKFKEKTSCQGVLCNLPFSGTEVIEKFGEEHLKTGFPIIYTSADSVFQIAAHTDKTDLDSLYLMCKKAREILIGEHEVSRVIARPFAGSPESFYRLSQKRKDYSVKPKGKTLLNFLLERDFEVLSIGKIAEIFANEGISTIIQGKSNEDCLQNITRLFEDKVLKERDQLIFANLVETDSNYGHRNDPIGFGRALERIDIEVGKWLELINQDDLLILTSDHGCDPTIGGTDHTREYALLLAYSKKFFPFNAGIRESFADHAASICDYFGLLEDWEKQGMLGKSYLNW